MAIVQCPYGHYYDNLKTESCPYCQKEIDNDDLGEVKTSSFFEDSIDDFRLTEMIGEDIQEFEKTIGIFADEETGNLYTVGWLVSICGIEKGKSYILHSGRNYASRKYDADIPLMEDGKISRDNHFSVVFDPKSNEFFVVEGNGQIYLNDEPISSHCKLAEGDVITLGESKFVFVPYCKEGRNWK